MALNIADLFEHAVDVVPERTALIVGERRMTYAELEAESNRLAHYLGSQGVGPGDLQDRLDNSTDANETEKPAVSVGATQ